MTQSGNYDIFFLGMPGSDTTRFYVEHFNKYIVKAKHSSCPNGLKLTSDTLEIRPEFSPEIVMVNDNPVDNMKITLLDSARTYLFCSEEPVTMRVAQQYESYQWFTKNYGYYGTDDYAIGDSISGETSDSATVPAALQWIRVVAEDANGCLGVSDPVLLNTMAFQSPVVLSHDNNEICEGDSVHIELAYPGNWSEFVWFKDGNEIPNSDNDTLWVSEPGEYVIGAYPTMCPDQLHTSGTGPHMHYFTVEIYEDVDANGYEYYYSFPWGPSYDIQWFLNGQAISGTPINGTYIVYKDSIQESGILTCEVTNTTPCTESDSIEITLTSTEQVFGSETEILVYPNPTTGIINIKGLDVNVAETVSVYSVTGSLMMTGKVNASMVSLALHNLPSGMYIVKITNKDGSYDSFEISKK
jgi:hypothetical protein